MRKIIAILCFILVDSFCFAQNDSILKTYRSAELYQDYDLLVNSLKEAHPGLYWYTSRAAFEKIFSENRAEIKDGMNSYDFYRVISKIVSADKEGHSQVYSSKDIGQFVNQKAKYLPFAIKTVDKKLYVLNNIGKNKTKGQIITHINEIPIDSIIQTIFEHTSRYSDGFSVTGKYRDLDHFGFSGLYMDFIDYRSENISLTTQNPDNDESTAISIDLISRDSLVSLAKTVQRIKSKHEGKLFDLEIVPQSKSAILTFNDFGYGRFEKQNLDFKSVVDSIFTQIKSSKIKNLIIDVRNVGGGTEGAEDYLFSYLTKKPYKKYQYVEANGFTFSFLDFTDYKDDREKLENMLKEEHEQTKDGRILRKKSVLPTEKPQKEPFKGNLYILCSGKTYSGGAEFVSIAKAYSDATIIGEETGGGFYGQTSGSYVYLLLPNTQMEIRIPLLRFYTTFTSDKIPFGRGVIPDYEVTTTVEEYVNGTDSELEFTLKLINKK
ncbi:S41 family peptidase [Olivibacter sitiensis]|uniref:S41 family peptidase n=1 Tax=Olivibacter sitiensis TaxID=376470 RepID=UPI0003F7AB9F|nr:S41 family peptidase [Olivibacter sitiensis]